MTGSHNIHGLPLGLAFLLAMLGLWLNHVAERPVAQDNGGFGHNPDYIVEKFDALAFSPNGRPLHRLSAARMTHYMDDDSTELISPRFEYLEASSAQAQVTARRGVISSNGEHVHFLGSVRAVRQPQDLPHSSAQDSPHVDQSAIILNSEYLWITPDAGIMRTDKPVTLRQGKSVITANELFANNKTGQLSLSGRVKSIYEK